MPASRCEVDARRRQRHRRRGKSLVIITGANSGGKSTFLRSVGLAQLMMQCGMFVTARILRASVCQQIFTHFIREEDAGHDQRAAR